MAGRFVEVDRSKLWVRSWGERSAPAVLCWHMLGAGQSGERFAPLAARLVEQHGFQVLAVDGPGFGRSPAVDPDRYRPSSLADLASGVLEAAALETADFVGASWGGTIGCFVAERHRERVRRLVLLDVGYQDALEPAPLETWVERASDRDDGVAADVRGPILWGVATEPPSAEQLARAGIPVLLLTATQPEEDREAIERFATVLPTAEIRRVEDAGHDLLAEAETAVVEIVADWLSR